MTAYDGRSDLSPRLDPTHLAVTKWAPGFAPAAIPPGFFGLVAGDDEVTVVCAEAEVSAVAGDVTPDALEHGWRRITFPGPLPWEQVGFLADVADRLAGAQIPFTTMAGFSTDHVLVRAAQADLAVSVLSGDEPPPARPGTTNP